MDANRARRQVRTHFFGQPGKFPVKNSHARMETEVKLQALPECGVFDGLG